MTLAAFRFPVVLGLRDLVFERAVFRVRLRVGFRLAECGRWRGVAFFLGLRLDIPEKERQ